MDKYLCPGGRENPNIYMNQNSNTKNLILSAVLSKKYTSIENSKSLVFLGFQISGFHFNTWMLIQNCEIMKLTATLLKGRIAKAHSFGL